MKKFASRRPVFAPSPDALATRGAEALRLGKFKDAMEIYKQLIRDDPRPEWRERLDEAYVGRARALAEKGMFKEATIVLENTLVTGGRVRAPLLYLSCLVRQGQHQKARKVGLDALGQQDGADSGRLADLAAALCLAFPGPVTSDDAPGAKKAFAEQTKAAQAALQTWLQGGDADGLDRVLGGIPLRSPFGPMRLILKSLTNPPDAAAKSRALLAMVSPDSAFAGARAAAEAALAEDQGLLEAWSCLRPAQQQFVAELRGLPREATGLLNQILDAEQRGPAALFSLLTRRGLALPVDDLRAACLNLLPAVPDRLAQFEQQFGPLSALECNRVLALSAEQKRDWETIAPCWHKVIGLLAHGAKPDAPLAQAVILRHLADLAQRHPDDWEDLDVAVDKDPVAHYLERSIELDPDYLPATLRLLERCRSDDDPKNWYRASEAAVQRFPANTAVLLHAVDAAASRDAYKKAAGFAHQVLTTDPINLPVRQRMIELKLAHARKQIQSSRADLAVKILAEAAEWERPEAPSAALRIGAALAAMAAGQDNAGPDVLCAAVREAGGGTVLWFHVVVEASLMRLPERLLAQYQQELQAARQSEPNRTMILALAGLLGQREIRSNRRAIAPAMRYIQPFLERGCSIAWSVAEFQVIAELLADLRAFRVLQRYASDALRREVGDPTARFYQVVARAEGIRDRLTMDQESELFTMASEAAERQDFHLLNRIQRFLLGPEATRARRLRSQISTEPEASETDMAELMAMLAGSAPVLPPKEVRTMVRELGRDVAVEMLAASMADSPMADALSEAQMARLCAALVAQALDHRPRPARRH